MIPRQQGNWPGQHIQLCAQAMRLEERLPDKAPIAYVYIYYVASRRRVKVPFTPQLRARTKAAIAQAFQVAACETENMLRVEVPARQAKDGVKAAPARSERLPLVKIDEVVVLGEITICKCAYSPGVSRGKLASTRPFSSGRKDEQQSERMIQRDQLLCDRL